MVTQDLSFTADDGVVLHAAIGGAGAITKRPLIIEDSPYAPGCCAALAGPHYNYIQLQWRGTGLSGGTWSATGSRDQEDLSQFVGWACQQPWSDGRIGLYGFSASAIAVYNTMHLPLPCVKAAALMAGTVDLYRDLLYIGGVPNLVPGAYVFGAVAAPWMQNIWGRVQQQPASIPASAEGYATVIPDVLAHSTEDSYWADRSFKGNANHIPILADTGFYDVEARGPFQAYRATRGDGSHLLVVGAHDGSPAGSGGPFPQYARWFDHYVRGIDNGIDREPPVNTYLSNGSREQLLSGHYTNIKGTDWPLPGTRWTSLFLSAQTSGTAHSVNDGSLSLTPDKPGSIQPYPFAPSDALVTDPHTTSTIAGLGIDQAATVVPALMNMSGAEPTSLTYTTAPFKTAIDAVGPASLDVFASSSAPETDLVAVLADVWPDGTAHPVAQGQLRTSFPHVDKNRSLVDEAGDIVQPYADFSAKELATPAGTKEYHVELPAIGNHFAVGHRLRLYVVGTSAYQLPPAPGVNTLSIGGVTPSRLLLPTIAALAPTTMAITGTTQGQATDATTLTARLTSGDSPVSGVPVTFAFQGRDYPATTDADGTATVPATVAGPAGTTPLQVDFAGDDSRQASSATAPYTVLPDDTTLTISGQRDGAGAVLRAQLSDDDGAPLPGQDVLFAVNGQPAGHASTGPDGVAELRTGHAPNTGDAVSATFASNDTYNGVSASTSWHGNAAPSATGSSGG